jgi:polyisoprenoid-binding protein YceI
MTWLIDSTHTEIYFTVRHLMISNVRGQFQTFGGTIDFDETHPADTTVAVQIDVASLSTGDATRDTHLKSPDFFDAGQYPLITFDSSRVVMKDRTHAVLYGDLVIRDQSNGVALDVEFNGQTRSPWGTSNAGFTARTQIKRRDWDLTWNIALETGGWLVGDVVRINIELEIVKQPAPELVAEAVMA